MTCLHAKKHGRAGAALLLLLMVLGLLALLLGSITIQIAANRRMLLRREHQMQALWLARSGVELAAAKWLADPQAYKGEKTAIIPESQVEIVVAVDKDHVIVTSEARYPADGPSPVVRAESCRFRRVQDGAKLRLESLK